MPGTLALPKGRDERVSLRYFKWEDLFVTEKPYVYLLDVPDGFPLKNFDFEDAPKQTIHDVRGRESSFNLDTHGFAIRSHTLSMTNFDRQSVEQEYFPEIERLLRQEIENVTDICIFDWRVWNTLYRCVRIDY
jgi:hypothetical protein